MRITSLFFASLLACAVAAAPSQASVLGGVIADANNEGTTIVSLLDNSVETLIDADASGDLSVGDILFGVLQIDSTAPPAALANNTLVGIFSQTFGSVDVVGNTATGSFVPTTAAGFTLSDLTGLAVDANAFLTGFEDPGGFSVDIGSFSVGDLGILDIPSLLSSIVSDGDFIFSAGIRDAAGPDPVFGNPDTGDFFNFDVSELALLNAGVGGATPPNDIQLGTFGGGFSILDNNIGAIFQDDLLALGLGGNTLAEVTVTGGSFSAVGPGLANGLFPISNNADFTISAIAIPEASAVIVWGLLSGMALSVGIRSKSSKK